MPVRGTTRTIPKDRIGGAHAWVTEDGRIQEHTMNRRESRFPTDSPWFLDDEGVRYVIFKRRAYPAWLCIAYAHGAQPTDNVFALDAFDAGRPDPRHMVIIPERHVYEPAKCPYCHEDVQDLGAHLSAEHRNLRYMVVPGDLDEAPEQVTFHGDEPEKTEEPAETKTEASAAEGAAAQEQPTQPESAVEATPAQAEAATEVTEEGAPQPEEKPSDATIDI